MPFWAKILLKIFTPDGDVQFLLGDIEEVYKECKKKNSLLYCNFWLLMHLVRTLPPIVFDHIIWSLAMFKNYMKMALRNIVKNKTYSIINITGLAIGLASCLVIFLAVNNEMSFDKFYDNADNIYRITMEGNSPQGVEFGGYTPYPMAGAIRTDYPEIKSVTQLMFVTEGQINIGIKQFREENIVYADSQFYDIFKLNLISGSLEDARNVPDGVVLTETIADKYFGNNPPIGEIIEYDNQQELRVVAVIEDIPTNTHMPINILISSKSLDEDVFGFNLNEWNVSISSSQTYFVMPASINEMTVEGFLENIAKKYLPERRKDSDKFHVQPLLDIHLNPELDSFNYSTSPKTLIVFALIGLLILVIASINFINLSTAQSLKRSKEVGVRKVLGANRSQIIKQLMGEVVTFTSIAVLISIGITYFLLPEINAFFDNSIELSLLDSISVLAFLLIVFVFVSVLTGLYPSILLSRFSPVEAFRSKVLKSKRGSFSLRNGLVIFQFIVSQVLIIGTIIISQQMDYFHNKDMGFEKEQILLVDIPDQDQAKMDLLRNKLMQNAQIMDVAFAVGAPISNANLNSAFAPDRDNPDLRIEVSLKPADENFFNVYSISLAAGESYSKYIEGDTLYQYVINETLAKKLGTSKPSEALGMTIPFHTFVGRVVGVVEDFHSKSLHEKIGPVMFMNFLARYHYQASIKLTGNVSGETMEKIQSNWEEVFPEFTYSSVFFDENIQELYEREEQFADMTRLFSILAIFIACLGLLGLVSFMAIQRTKEIGLRKVMGAKNSSILVLLSKEFTKWVLLANILAWPIAYYAMDKWLEDFAYKIEIGFWVFLAGGVLSLVIAWVTVSLQSYKATLANPVDSIRTE